MRRLVRSLGSIATCIALSGCGSLGYRPTLHGVRYGMEISYTGAVRVTNGHGWELMTYEPVAKTTTDFAHAYFDPEVSPDGRTMLLIRCNGISKPEYGSWQLEEAESYDLLEVDLDTFAETILRTSDHGLWRPTWRPDGRRYAFVDCDEIVVIDKDSGDDVCRVRCTGSLPEWYHHGVSYMRWHAERDVIYVLGIRWVHPPGTDPAVGEAIDAIGEVDIERATMHWLPLQV